MLDSDLQVSVLVDPAKILTTLLDKPKVMAKPKPTPLDEELASKQMKVDYATVSITGSPKHSSVTIGNRRMTILQTACIGSTGILTTDSSP